MNIIELKETAPPERVFPIEQTGAIIGRTPDCAITLNDQAVSREHAWIGFRDNQLIIEDRGSRNGVLLNGTRTQYAPVKAGDRILIGNTEFVVVEHADSFSPEDTTIDFDTALNLENELAEENKGQALWVLYQASRLMASEADLKHLLDGVLTLIFEALPVKRGYIVTRERNGEIDLVASRAYSQDQTPPLSSAILHTVMGTKEGILTYDALDDSSLDQSESMIAFKIHSAMCVPLWGRKCVTGAIYVDSGETKERFTPKQLEMLASVGRVIGSAVENAQLREEHLRQERLAALGQATAGMGHCIKNILTGVRAGCEFITKGIEDEDLNSIQRGWPVLARTIDRIQLIMLNMLDYSAERKPQCQPCNLNDLVEDALATFRSRAERYNVQLQFSPKEPVTIPVDHQLIYRVFMNLLANAMDVCEQYGGAIQVVCVKTGHGAEITFSDTGPGIPEAIQRRIPEAFVTSKGSGGTGLGLACCYKLVEKHGGAITFTSRKDVGTTFTVTLPDTH